jgi:8-oxo-dGTP pyrophosphatase MutT (NUDIX family)
MFINKFISDIKLELAKELPSYDAHQRMMPSTRVTDMLTAKISNATIRSSVLILLYPKDEKLNTVFIKRQEYNGVHSGQFAFPGGKYEKNDLNLINTALREANEEIGIEIKSVEILGQLSELYIPPSNFLVLPIVAYMPSPPLFILNNKEVNKIIEVSLSELLSPENVSENEFIGFGNKRIVAPCYDLNNHKIWGATAMIISELIEIIHKIHN